MPPPVHVVVPVVKDHLALTRSLIDQLRGQGGYERMLVYDNGSGPETAEWLASLGDRDGIEVVAASGRGIYAMWQDGVDRARQRAPDSDIAILSDDLVLGPDFLGALGRALHSDPKVWAVSARYDDRPVEGVEYVSGTLKSLGLAGFAFMVRGTAFDHVAFDRSFSLRYGDDDLVAQIESLGHKVAITGATWVERVGGGSRTLRRQRGTAQRLRRDRDRMIAKWGHAGPEG